MAILCHGFRPFFLAGAIYAGFAMLTWLQMLSGHLILPTHFSPTDWHSHEILFGYLAAIIAGFLLTAVTRWTERPPLSGLPLLALVMLWLVGRVAIATSAIIGWQAAAFIDLSFLIALAGVVAREILAGEDRRNLTVVGIIVLLAVANAVFHLETVRWGAAGYAARFGLSVAIVLIMVMAGRIVTRYTRTWLARMSPGRLPAEFGLFDSIAIAFGAIALACWIARPVSQLTGLALIGAAIFQILRLARWAGERTFRNPLLFVMHVGYGFIPAGFLLAGYSSLSVDGLPASAGIHAWGAGAIGTMTLAVMIRTSLRHTGHALKATPAILVLLVAVIAGAVARILSACAISGSHEVMLFAGYVWCLAFFGFAAAYGPTLTRSRLA